MQAAGELEGAKPIEHEVALDVVVLVALLIDLQLAGVGVEEMESEIVSEVVGALEVVHQLGGRPGIVRVDLRKRPAADVSFEGLVFLQLDLRRVLLGRLLVELRKRDLFVRDDLHFHPAIDAPLDAVGDDALDLVLIVFGDDVARLHLGARRRRGERQAAEQREHGDDTDGRGVRHRTTPFEPAAWVGSEPQRSRPSIQHGHKSFGRRRAASGWCDCSYDIAARCDPRGGARDHTDALLVLSMRTPPLDRRTASPLANGKPHH